MQSIPPGSGRRAKVGENWMMLLNMTMMIKVPWSKLLSYESYLYALAVYIYKTKMFNREHFLE